MNRLEIWRIWAGVQRTAAAESVAADFVSGR
jgi:hypothetical protein